MYIRYDMQLQNKIFFAEKYNFVSIPDEHKYFEYFWRLLVITSLQRF